MKYEHLYHKVAQFNLRYHCHRRNIIYWYLKTNLLVIIAYLTLQQGLNVDPIIDRRMALF